MEWAFYFITANNCAGNLFLTTGATIKHYTGKQVVVGNSAPSAGLDIFLPSGYP
ncbi:MAG: hypothetical protein RLZZ367_775 [Bacteroidota bacterium]|jgi:hypothetical protein